MDLYYLLLLILMNLLPLLELRLSIPVGILIFQLPWELVFTVSVLVHIILAPILYLILDKALGFFIRYKWIENFYNRHVARVQQKAKPYVEKYGLLGLSLFIFAPLPGSGTYTGTLAAWVLGFGYKKLFIANAIGMFFNGLLWTALSLMGAIAINGLTGFA